MRIIIICDEFTLDDVTALGRYLRDQYKESPHEIRVLVDSQKVPAEEAVAALQTIFGGNPHWMMRIIPLGGNGNK